MYCSNNPINDIDSCGEWSLKSFFKGIGDFFKENWDVVVGTITSALLVAGGLAISIFSGGSLAPLGAALISGGVGGFINGVQSKWDGGSFWGGYLGGVITGAISAVGMSFGPTAALVLGAVGYGLGTYVTDAINGVDQSSSDYLLGLTIDSIINGFVSIFALSFGNASNILNKPGFRDLYASITVCAEFAFSYLYEGARKFVYDFANSLRRRFAF